MSTAWRLGVVLTLLGMLGSAARATGGPTLQRVEMERIQTDTVYQGVVTQNSGLVMARVQVPEGVSTLTSVTITAPNGDALVITPGATGNRAWVVESDTLVRAEWRGTLATSGTYTVTAAAGVLQDSLTLSPPPEVPATTSLRLTAIAYDATTVTWTGGTDAAAENTLYLYKQPKELSWQYTVPGAVSSVAYNADGLASEPALVRGHTYLYRFDAKKPQDAGVTDPRVFTYTLYQKRGRFVVAASTPTVLQATINRSYSEMAPNWLGFVDEIEVTASDLEGGGDISQVSITDPSGVTRTMGVWILGDYFSAVTEYTTDPIAAAAATGVYTITVTDAEGHSSSFTTPEIGVPPLVALTEPASDGVITSGVPTLAWQIDAASFHKVWVTQEGSDGLLWDYVPMDPGLQSVGYNHDGHAVAAELAPGYSYLLEVEAGSGDMEDLADVRVTAPLSNLARFRFTYPTAGALLPELAGKLAYSSGLGGMSDDWDYRSLLQYHPDPSVRDWIGPVSAEEPAWSPDGTKLMYFNTGIWVDPLDGSYPVQIGGDWSTDGQWSRDGSQVVYAQQYTDLGHAIRIANADGTGLQTVIDDADRKRNTTWSPDGTWIGYRRVNSTIGERLWLVRPDGTDDHQLSVTGITGYPGYEAGYVGEHDWAPDAQRLSVDFDATNPSDSGAPYVHGIGVVPVGGGAITPVFLVSEDVVCCPSPKMPASSPDGTKIVFSSGHHLPVNPSWSSGIYEPGVELWMISADGSGEPTRLTENHSMDLGVSWWAPAAFTDVPKGNWAYCAVSTCYQSGIVQGYADGYHPADPVTRAQMAVFIARALAGGDALVPTGSATATFADVPTDYWAYRYVEYLADPSRDIVRGYGDGYHPEEQVSRAQMAVYIARAIADPLGEAGLTAYTPPTTASFADVPTDYWAYRYVEYCKAEGVVNGYGDGYHPDDNVTRDQMAVYIARAFGLVF